MASKIPIVAVASNGEVAGYFESIAEAGRRNNFNPRNLRHALKNPYGMRKCLGFCWLPKDTYIEICCTKGKEALCYKRDSNRNTKGQFVVGSKYTYHNSFANKSPEWMAEYKQRCRERLTRQWQSGSIIPSNNRARPVRDLTTGEIFASGKEWAEKYNFNRTHIPRAIQHGWLMHGHRLEYASKKEYNDYIIENGYDGKRLFKKV